MHGPYDRSRKGLIQHRGGSPLRLVGLRERRSGRPLQAAARACPEGQSSPAATFTCCPPHVHLHPRSGRARWGSTTATPLWPSACGGRRGGIAPPAQPALPSLRLRTLPTSPARFLGANFSRRSRRGHALRLCIERLVLSSILFQSAGLPFRGGGCVAGGLIVLREWGSAAGSPACDRVRARGFGCHAPQPSFAATPACLRAGVRTWDGSRPHSGVWNHPLGDWQS
jgi:hypothetical protein